MSRERRYAQIGSYRKSYQCYPCLSKRGANLCIPHNNGDATEHECNETHKRVPPLGYLRVSLHKSCVYIALILQRAPELPSNVTSIPYYDARSISLQTENQKFGTYKMCEQ